MMALAEPLIEQAAAWIRDNAWTKRMRHEHGDTPGHYQACACEYGASDWCQMDKHAQCHRGVGLPADETIICGRGGMHPLFFAEPFTHPTAHAVGPRRERLAMVWLADRVCRWVCPCTCHAPAAPVRPRQLDLFEVMA